MGRIVVKYGGSSLASLDKIEEVAGRIIKMKEKYDDIVCVVSAMGETTDNLIESASRLSSRPQAREMDMLISTGEQMSAALLSLALNDKGYRAISLTGDQAGFKTMGRHQASIIDYLDTSRVETSLEAGYIVIIAGFQGVNEEGDITTLGRGGSDTSAVALAASLNSACHIYTDVDGIYTMDPRLNKQARKLDYLTYEETLEMANLGAKVLQARSVLLAEKYDVPLYIASSSSDERGTQIVDRLEITERRDVTSLSLREDLFLVNVQTRMESLGDMGRVFANLADQGVVLDIVSQSQKCDSSLVVSFTAALDDRETIEEVLLENNMNFSFIDNIVKLSLVGSGMRSDSQALAKIFQVFSENGIEFYQISTSEISISYVIDGDKKMEVVRLLAEAFDL